MAALIPLGMVILYLLSLLVKVMRENKKHSRARDESGESGLSQVGSNNTVQCSTVKYSIVQYSTVQYSIVHGHSGVRHRERLVLCPLYAVLQSPPSLYTLE